eukprot:16610-Chlamydomonas_euryale.AAC.4
MPRARCPGAPMSSCPTMFRRRKGAQRRKSAQRRIAHAPLVGTVRHTHGTHPNGMLGCTPLDAQECFDVRRWHHAGPLLQSKDFRVGGSTERTHGASGVDA